jgi:hypothetical protein
MTGIMAGSIIATMPTIHTSRNEERIPPFGEANVLAMLEIGSDGIEDSIPMDEELCTKTAERYHAPAAAARRGIPTESLNPKADCSVTDFPRRN